MAEKRFDANYTFKFNSVPFQNLFSPNQLRIDNWNKIVNQLSAQGNNLSQYLVNLNNWLFGTTTISYSTEDSTGFLQDLDNRVKENLRKININSTAINNNTSAISINTNAINTINSTLSSHTIRIADLEGSTTNNALEITNIYGQLDSHNTAIGNHTSELDILTSDLDGLKDTVNGLQSDINSKVNSVYVDQQVSEAKGYTDAKIVSVNLSIDSLKSNTVAGIKVIDNPTAEAITNKVKPYLGTSAQADTGTGVGQVPTIQPDGKLSKSIIPISDGLIYGGTIERFRNDNTANILPSDDFVAKYPNTVQGVEITITTDTTDYSSVYFVVKNASNVTILGQENCEVGDWIIAQGANGFDKIDNVDAVKSVNGMRGVVEIKPKDLILENYVTSELDDNNIYPTDSTQTGLSKLDKRTKVLEENSVQKAPDVILNVSSFETLTATEKALIVEKIKSITNNFSTDLVYELFNDIKLQNYYDADGPSAIRTYSLVGYEYIEANKYYYKFTFNLSENTELLLTVVDTEEVTIETIEFAKKSDLNKIIVPLEEIEALVDELNGDVDQLLDIINGEEI